MGTRESKYRTVGVVYVFLGVWFCVFFLWHPMIQLFVFVPFGHYIWRYIGFMLLFVVCLAMVVGSFVLVLFGFVLVFRGGLWFARFSGVLYGFLVVSNVLMLILPLSISPG